MIPDLLPKTMGIKSRIEIIAHHRWWSQGNYCPKLGWLSPPTSTSIGDLLITSAVVGFCLGQIHWSDMKRKFDTLPPGEDWTMK
jgi:hypothetical protein